MDHGTSYWNKKYEIPIPDQKETWTLTGFSKAAYRTGFIIEELNIMFDAGPQTFKGIDHIFITHTHGDHISLLPFTVISRDDHIYNVYAPKKSITHLRSYVNALFQVNRSTYNTGCKSVTYNPVDSSFQENINIKGKDFLIKSYNCDHSVQTFGYGITLVKTLRKSGYKRKISDEELRMLKINNISYTYQIRIPKLVFLCDSSIKVLENPEVFKYPVMIIECTFLLDDELDLAKKKKHIHWKELKPYILEHPDIHFILIHFSMRYTDLEIQKYFEKEKIPNVYPWINYTKKSNVRISLV